MKTHGDTLTKRISDRPRRESSASSHTADSEGKNLIRFHGFQTASLQLMVDTVFVF
jgi:hypothetical protein